MSALPASLRFNLDREYYDELLAHEVIGTLAKKRLQDAEHDSYRRDLLGRSLRIKASMAPELYALVEAAQNKMGLGDKHVEVYVYNDAGPNASCSYLGDDQIILSFSSGLLQTMNTDELSFVVGHEMGHALFEHFALPTHGILDGGNLNAEDAMKVMSWSRRAEISADRAGLYACEKPEAAITSFLKLSCGIAAPLISFDLAEYSNQIRDLGTLANNLEDTSHCYSSHPFNPIRIMAVDLYARSEDYLQSIGQSGAELSLAEVDKEIAAVLAFMEPLPDDQQQAIINDIVFWAGAWLALADGEFHRSEHENLLEQVGAEKFEVNKALLDASGDPLAFAKQRFFASCGPVRTMAAPNRCSLVQRLVAVARADQQVDDAEAAVLDEICDELKVERSFVQQILLFLN